MRFKEHFHFTCDQISTPGTFTYISAQTRPHANVNEIRAMPCKRGSGRDCNDVQIADGEENGAEYGVGIAEGE
jgi:hypothetical protein